MIKNSKLLLTVIACGMLVACNSGVDDGYGYDECYYSYNCDGPYMDAAGTSGTSVANPVQAQTIIGTTQDIDLVIQSTKPVSNLTFDNLSSLSKEWSYTNNFNCSNLETDGYCLLNLHYNPTSIENGNFKLKYSYTTTDNIRHRGFINVDYAGTLTNNVHAEIPAIIETPLNTTKQVQLSFISDDNKKINNLEITKGIDNLAVNNPGWSAPATFSCNSETSQCTLNLSYTPTTSKDNGIVALDYSYVNNNGQAVHSEAKIIYRVKN